MSISLDLIEIADLTRPKDIVNEIINQNPNIEVPIPIEEIAYKSGIAEIKYQDMDGLEGTLVANPEKSIGIIGIKKSSRHHRQRFTLGHELGHFLIPSHGSQMNCSISDLISSDNSNQHIEIEANTFSAELLMPEKIFKSQSQFKSEPSIQNIKELSSIFDVSFSACAKRYIALSDYQVYVIFCENKKVRYWEKSSEVELWLSCKKKGSSVHHNSVTSKQSLDNIDSITEDCVDAEVWFNEDKNYELPSEVIEQVHIQNDGFSATLLWIEEELIEKE